MGGKVRTRAQLLLEVEALRAQLRKAEDALAVAESRERALRAKEAEYRLYVEQASDGIIVHDGATRTIAANSKACEMLGYSKEEFLRLDMSDLICAEDLAQVPLRLPELLRKKGIHSERRFCRKNGTLFPVEITARMIENGRIVTIVRDVTERKRAEEEFRKSEQRFRVIFENAAFGIGVTDIRMQGKLVETNPALQRMLGYSREEFCEMTLRQFTHPDDLPKATAAFKELMTEKRDSHQTERRFIRKDGATVYGRLTASLIRGVEGQPEFAVGMIEDITARKSSEESRERLIEILNAASDYISIASVDGKQLYINPAGRRLVGIGEDEDISKVSVRENHPAWAAKLILEEGNPTAVREGMWAGENAFLTRDGREIPVSQVIIAHKGPDGAVDFFSTIVRDISELKKHEVRLAYMATHDSLTDLPNRRSLEEAMNRVVARAHRGVVSALLFTDLDNFKYVNDTFGHAAGDRALVTVTNLLKSQLRTEDMLARLGGDEFAVLLEATGVEDARVVAERMRQVVEEFDFEVDDHRFKLSLSVGMAVIDRGIVPQMLLSMADAAMYRAKEAGKNRVVVYQP